MLFLLSIPFLQLLLSPWLLFSDFFFYSNYLHKLSFWLNISEMQPNLYWLHD